MTPRSPFDLDRLLRSWWCRGVGGLLLVIVVSLVETVPRMEIASLRGWEVDRLSIFLQRFYVWAAWGLLAWPIFLLASWLLRASGSWLVLFLVHLPLSGAIAWGIVLFEYELRVVAIERVREAGREERDETRPPPPPDSAPPRSEPGRERGERGERGGRRGGPRGRMERPSFGSYRGRERWLQSVLIYWAILGLGAGLHSFLEMRRKDRRTAELELRSERLRTQLAQAQVASLQSQLHPHFLFNALHSVGGLIRGGDDVRAVKTLAAIGELLRFTLDHGERERVPLREEWRTAERYLEIEGIRFGDRLSVSIESEPDVRDVPIPALLLLPLVENAVHHGVAPRPEGGRVSVAARRDGDRVVIEVSDDGPGFPAGVLAGGNSELENGRRCIGIQNSRERLLALYGEEQRFELENPVEGGAVVRISLPVAAAVEGAEDDGERT